MSDTTIQRLQRDVEDLALRVRQVENSQHPMGQQLSRDVTELKNQVSHMDVEGTAVTRVRLGNIEEDIREIKEDSKSLRVTIRSALITAGLSIAVQVILFFILRSQ